MRGLQARRSRSGPKTGSGPASAATSALKGRWATTIDFYLLIVLLIVCCLGGGSSFAETPSLLYVRPVAVLCFTTFMLTPARADWRAIAIPAALLGALAIVMVVQLVPLPPRLWLSLPGRALYAREASAAGIPQPWRPLSLTPDLTANSLAALIVPAAVLAGFAKLRGDQRRALVMALIVVCIASAALGIAEFASGDAHRFYLYRRTYEGFPVGFLSNRNHQAVLLGAVFPALRVWTLEPTSSARRSRWRLAVAAMLAAITVPVILATGSRAGMALSTASIIVTSIAFPIRVPRSPSTGQRGRSPKDWLIRTSVPVSALCLGGATYWLGRAVSIDRLSEGGGLAADHRFDYAPIVGRTIRSTFPFGTGFGSFDPVFRGYEPDAVLTDVYFNHAHNDLLELIMTAGLPGVVLLLAFLSWWGTGLLRSWRAQGVEQPNAFLVRLGGIVVALFLCASLADYPLRTSLMMAVFALACGWSCSDRFRPVGQGSW